MNASISQAEGRVEFLDDGAGSVSNGSVRELECRLQQCIRLQEQLSAANRQLATDPRYIQKVGVVMMMSQLVLHMCTMDA